jgi:hypothetical protein
LSVLVAKGPHTIPLQSTDEFIRKALGWHMNDTPCYVLLANMVADGLEQVGLS